MSNVGLEPGDNIEVHDMESPVTWPLYALVDDCGGCISYTYICAKHMKDPVARLRCVTMAHSQLWEGSWEGQISPAGFTGVDGILVPDRAPTFDVGGEIVSCADCWA